MERIQVTILGSTDKFEMSKSAITGKWEIVSGFRTPVSEKYWENPKFIMQRTKAYAQLLGAGFEDVECGHGEYTVTRQEFRPITGRQNGSGPDAQEICSAILRDFKFKRDMHRAIFERHTEGMSYADIAKWLSTHELYKPMTFQGVANLIDSIKQDYARG
jgi:hypothetical protein